MEVVQLYSDKCANSNTVHNTINIGKSSLEFYLDQKIKDMNNNGSTTTGSFWLKPIKKPTPLKVCFETLIDSRIGIVWSTSLFALVPHKLFTLVSCLCYVSGLVHLFCGGGVDGVDGVDGVPFIQLPPLCLIPFQLRLKSMPNSLTHTFD